jgi:tetratricopeptide (TPR) repeat protein
MNFSLAEALLGMALLSAAIAVAQTPNAPSGDAKDLLARADAAWPLREEPGKLDAIRADLEAAERAAADDYGVLWRLSRLYFWLSDDPALPAGEKSQLGKKGWELGDRASAANPTGVEGWFYAAGGMGNYSLGIGILNALSQGIEGKFKERLSKAEGIDPGFNAGGISNAWGRFYYKLPWPKYDAKKSESSLRKAIKVNPDNVRARVYLAELYLKENHPKEGRKLLEEAIAHEPGRYDGPEERRYQKRAKDLLAQR